jgi:hypothetical protein
MGVSQYLSFQAVIMLAAVLQDFATNEPSHNLLAVLLNELPHYDKIQAT